MTQTTASLDQNLNPAEPGNPRIYLPPGYTVLNDGPGREVLSHADWEECPVCKTVAEAVAYARYLEDLPVVQGLVT